MIKLIIAVDHGNAIGWSDGDLAYRDLKLDMRRFKELTTGGTVIMGFNTFASLKRPTGLPNRKNIVLTRKPYREAREFFSASSDIDIISSLDYVRDLVKRQPERDLWIIGGKSVYEEALKMGIVDEIYMTLIHADCEADVRLDIDLAAWKLYVIREREHGIFWEPIVISTQLDGGLHTTYIHLAKQP